MISYRYKIFLINPSLIRYSVQLKEREKKKVMENCKNILFKTKRKEK